MVQASLFVVLVCTWSGIASAEYRINLGGDDMYDLFVDGNHFGGDDRTHFYDSFILPTSTRVIGIRATDSAGLGGIIASIKDGSRIFVTDSINWKCSATYSEGWAAPGFDDRFWETPTIYVRPDGYRPRSVDRGAHWIWTSNYNYGDKVVYCRTVIDTVKATVTADHVLDVFVDGQFLGQHVGGGEAKQFDIPTTARVIGLRGYRVRCRGGIIGSFSDGLVTDASWKCGSDLVEGWSTAGFDDSRWKNAVVQSGTYTYPDGDKPLDIDNAAQWIWVDSNPTIAAYCRIVRAYYPYHMSLGEDGSGSGAPVEFLIF